MIAGIENPRSIGSNGSRRYSRWSLDVCAMAREYSIFCCKFLQIQPVDVIGTIYGNPQL